MQVQPQNVFTFGGTIADSSASPKELGPMTEDEQGTGVYSISGTIDETENSVLSSLVAQQYFNVSM